MTADEGVIALAGVDGAKLVAGLDAGVPEDEEEEEEGGGAPPARGSLNISHFTKSIQEVTYSSPVRAK